MKRDGCGAGLCFEVWGWWVGVGGRLFVVCAYILGLCWPLVGAMLPQLAVMWAHLGAMLAHLGAMLAHLGGDGLSGMGFVRSSW